MLLFNHGNVMLLVIFLLTISRSWSKPVGKHIITVNLFKVRYNRLADWYISSIVSFIHYNLLRLLDCLLGGVLRVVYAIVEYFLFLTTTKSERATSNGITFILFQQKKSVQ